MAAADAEMESLLERVQALVPSVSPEAAEKTIGMLRGLHADCSNAFAAALGVSMSAGALRQHADSAPTACFPWCPTRCTVAAAKGAARSRREIVRQQR